MSRAARKLVRRSTSAKTARLARPPAAPQLTVAEFASTWLHTRTLSLGLKPNTVSGYATRLRMHILPYWGARSMASITSDDVDAWRDRMIEARKLGRSSINLNLTTFRTMLRTAARKKIIHDMPEVQRLRGEDEERPWLTEEEYELVVEAAGELELRKLAFVLLGGDAGLRIGEMLNLRRDHIEDNTISIKGTRSKGHEGSTKTEKGRRRVPMTKRLRKCLDALARERPVGNRVLARDGDEPCTEAMLRGWLEQAVRLSEIAKTGISPHSLRHTFISHLDAKGVPVTVIQRLVGHSNLATTQKYLHMDEDRIKAAIAALRD